LTSKENNTSWNPPEWVPGGVAANIIGITHQRLIDLALTGKIKRCLFRISHAQRKPSWHYPLKRVEELKKKYGQKSVYKDISGNYVSTYDAAKMLDVSVNSVYSYIKTGSIASKTCSFKYPTRKTCLGCRLADVLAIRIKQTSTEVLSSYEEEVVIKQKTVRLTVPYQSPLQGNELVESIKQLLKDTKKADLKTAQFTEHLESLIYGHAA